MRRSTAIAILVAAAVLVAAGNLPRVRWDQAGTWARTAWTHAAATWPHARAAARIAPHPSSRALASAARPAPPPAHVPVALPRLLVTPGAAVLRPAFALPAAALLGGLVAAVLLALLSGFAWRARSDRRGRVFQMARRGLPAHRIAHRIHVPQDAIRTLLTPGMGTRR